MPKLIQLTALAAVALLAGCGTGSFDRVSTGAGAGAATGAAIGLLGGPIGVAAGAAIGAGAGAVAGGVTAPNQVDLGKPVWQSSGGDSTSQNLPPQAAPAPEASAPAPATAPTTPVEQAPL
jgi:hypothetical protein